jgi:dinuclear metal center YbgI/SA1388 family protein
MSIKCAEIKAYMNSIAPEGSAEKWDNVGLLVGKPDKVIKKLLICLDVTPEIIDEATDKDADMIISHHPLIFSAMKRITSDTQSGRNIIKLIEKGICVYSAHTNLDMAENGVNEVLAGALGIVNGSIIDVKEREQLYKIITYVPESHAESVRNALCSNGAGDIGNYDSCSFTSLGTGTFRPQKGTKPFIGSEGKLEEVKEARIETIVPAGELSNAISAMVSAHPYEEPAYDIIKLELDGRKKGFGIAGDLKESMPFSDFIDLVKTRLSVGFVRTVGCPKSDVIKRAAVFSGSYGLEPASIAAVNADVLVTGDLKYHDAMDAVQAGLCIIDAGHYNTEKVIIPVLADMLRSRFTEIDVIEGKAGRDPFVIY